MPRMWISILCWRRESRRVKYRRYCRRSGWCRCAVLQLAGQINGPADLLNCPSVHILGYEDHWDHYLSPFRLHQDSRQSHLQVDTFVAAAELVANNLGCAVVLERFARGAIDGGRPLSIAGDPVAITQRHYLAVPSQCR